MDSLVAIPAFLCMAGLLRWGPQKTFLYICVPILAIVPTYFRWKINGVPDLDSGICVMIPLGFALILPFYRRWTFTRTDLWLLFYIFTSGYPDFRIGEVSMAKYRLFDVITQAVIPYMAGKLLIEQVGARYETSKRLIQVLFVTCIFAMPEFFIKFNLFVRLGLHLFPGQAFGWWTQVRGGFGRATGPYGAAEIYGVILILGVMLLLWVLQREVPFPSFSPVRWLTSRQAIVVCLATLMLTLYMTQSRGPWLGALLALPIALVGRAERLKRAAILTTAVLVLVAIPSYVAFDHYSSGPRTDYGSERETAQYRRDLLTNYIPMGKQGGLWGWGTFHPLVGGQSSIDNEFLRVWVAQGSVGLSAYVLLILEACYSLLRVGFSTESKQNRHFCFTMVGIFAGWTFTLCTVYMGLQSYQLFFILVGWSQAVPYVRGSLSKPSKQSRQTAPAETALELERVYT